MHGVGKATQQSGVIRGDHPNIVGEGEPNPKVQVQSDRVFFTLQRQKRLEHITIDNLKRRGFLPQSSEDTYFLKGMLDKYGFSIPSIIRKDLFDAVTAQKAHAKASPFLGFDLTDLQTKMITSSISNSYLLALWMDRTNKHAAHLYLDPKTRMLSFKKGPHKISIVSLFPNIQKERNWTKVALALKAAYPEVLNEKETQSVHRQIIAAKREIHGPLAVKQNLEQEDIQRKACFDRTRPIIEAIDKELFHIALKYKGPKEVFEAFERHLETAKYFLDNFHLYHLDFGYYKAICDSLKKNFETLKKHTQPMEK